MTASGAKTSSHWARTSLSWPVPVQTLADVDVDQADGGVADIDGDLARPRYGVRQLGELEDPGSPKRVTTAACM
jgi:hypothetical protein